MPVGQRAIRMGTGVGSRVACLLLMVGFGVVTCASVEASQGEEWTIPAEHPRLLIHREELAALRKRCGVVAYRDSAPAEAEFAGLQAAWQRVRALADRTLVSGVSPGQLYAPALAHLVLGEIGTSDEYVRRVEQELRNRPRLLWQQDDAVIALDWCWDAISPDVRRSITQRLAAQIVPLEDRVSPLDHVAFYPRVCDVAAAIALFDPDDRVSPEAAQVRAVLVAARRYLEGPFVRLWQQKGPAASSPANGLFAEADAVFAAEIWQTGTGRALWPQLGDSLGRSVEAYFWSYTGRANMRFGFPRDDGSWAPDSPGAAAESWSVAVPWVVAARSGSGVARWFVDELPEPSAAQWRISDARALRDTLDLLAWPRVIYGGAAAPAVFRQACPLGRHVPRGFVLMRTDWSPDAAVVMADVGQPYWRAQQHFDAGHFQILRSGRLTTGSGEDVALDAVPEHGGDAYIGSAIADWDQFAQATVAHNCITVFDPMRMQQRYGRPWPAHGNQRIVERSYRLGDPPIDETDRVTGRLIAFETNSFYTYAAADLSLAYPIDLVRSYTRHFLLLNRGVLFVCDRVVPVRPRTRITWHLQLPERPRVGGADPAEGDRLAGATNAAGVWEVKDAASWVDVTEGDGRLYVRTLWPQDAARRVIGGPKKPMTITEGPWAGRVYFGSDAGGYERRLLPATENNGGPQAWYRLGRPPLLGPQFGLRSNWGRLDVSSIVQARETEKVFLHALVPTDAATAYPPNLEMRATEDEFVVQIALPGGRCEVTWLRKNLQADGRSAGRVTILDRTTGETTFHNELATTIAPDKPLPGEKR